MTIELTIKFHEEFDYCNATYKSWKSRSRVSRVVQAFRSYNLSDDLKWNAHVEYVIAKAAKRLYALR